MEPEFLPTEENFLGLEEEFSSFGNSGVVIQSLPYEHTSSYLVGSANGPKAIIDASHYVEFYDEELERNSYESVGICTLKSYSFGERVDAEAISFIQDKTSQLIKENKFVVSLGAEHTVSLGTIKAFNDNFENLSVLQIDAHSDLRQEYESNQYSHACVMARVHELGVPISQVGVRAQCQEEADLIKSSDLLSTVYGYELFTEGWIEKAIGSLSDNVYITVDADGFDPSLVGAVGTPEPGGLTWEMGIGLFTALKKSGKNIVGFDVVEVLPKRGEILSQYTMAKLTYKLIGLFA